MTPLITFDFWTLDSGKASNEEALYLENPEPGVWQFILFGWESFEDAEVNVILGRIQP